MDNKTKLLHRLLALFVVLALLCGVSAAGLYSLQIINGEQYRLQAERHLTSTSVVSAARGEILDRYGRPLVTNESVYSIRFDYAYWDFDNQNDILLQLVQLVISAGVDVPTALPITQQEPYTFTCSADDTVYTTLTSFIDEKNGTSSGQDKLGLKSKYGVSEAKELDAPSVLAVLKSYYNISDSYTPSNARWILEQRYRMSTASFSRTNPFIFVEDVPMDLIAEIKERSSLFKGVNIETSTVRKYETDCAAQILGRTGIIYKEDWDKYKDKGYSMTDIVGKSGLEMSMEEYLRGKKGSRMVDTDVTGEVTGTMEATAPQPGPWGKTAALPTAIGWAARYACGSARPRRPDGRTASRRRWTSNCKRSLRSPWQTSSRRFQVHAAARQSSSRSTPAKCWQQPTTRRTARQPSSRIRQPSMTIRWSPRATVPSRWHTHQVLPSSP